MTHYFKSPIGWLELSGSENFLHSIRFLDHKSKEYENQVNPLIKQTISELSEYFEGDRREFSVPLDPEGTNFQKSVWEELQEVSYGRTITYGELAHKLGDPNKVRAVGKANGTNSIPIIIPCHRVIGGNNKLIGYSGGIARKKYLLQHEGAILL